MDHECSQTSRIDRLERDVAKHDVDISELKEGQAEGRVFQKLIMEQLGEIKLMLNTYKKSDTQSNKPNEEWINLIKWVLSGTIIAIVAWMIKTGL